MKALLLSSLIACSTLLVQANANNEKNTTESTVKSDKCVDQSMAKNGKNHKIATTECRRKLMN